MLMLNVHSVRFSHLFSATAAAGKARQFPGASSSFESRYVALSVSEPEPVHTTADGNCCTHHFPVSLLI